MSAMIKLYRPVVSATAQPMNIVVVMVPFISDGVTFADTRAKAADHGDAGAQSRTAAYDSFRENRSFHSVCSSFSINKTFLIGTFYMQRE